MYVAGLRAEMKRKEDLLYKATTDARTQNKENLNPVQKKKTNRKRELEDEKINEGQKKRNVSLYKCHL